jgi:protein SMG9
MSSRPSASKSLYVPSATKSPGRSTESIAKHRQSQDQVRPSHTTSSQERQKQIVILERSGLADELERLLKEDKCWILDEINNENLDTGSSTLKLMDEGLQMAKWEYSFHSNYDYTVIGAVGFSGVGKSTILSKIAGDHLSSFSVSKNRKLGTAGLDLFITPERVILIDSQPVLSPLVLEKLKSKRLIPGSFSRRAHQWNEVLSKRMTAFLWSICDVLLVVLDDFTFSKMLEFLMSLDDKGFTKNAKVIFIFNKSSANIFQPEKYQKLINDIRRIPGINWEDQDCCSLKEFYPDLYSKLEDSNLFLLPCFSISSYNLSLDMSKESFNAYRQSLMGLPNDFSVLFYQFRLELMSMIPAKNTQTEKEWFKSAMEVWEEILKIKWHIST